MTTERMTDHFYQDRAIAIEQFAYRQYRQIIEGPFLTFGIKKVNGDYFVRTRLGLLPVNQAGRGYEPGNP